jgi:uncharacterized membrane protein
MTNPPAEAPESRADLTAYHSILDPDRLQGIADAVPGGAEFVLGMIKADQEHLAALQKMEAERDHKVRLLTVWLTVFVILAITAGAVWVILAGHAVAGSVLATCDLVALSNVFINSMRRR